MNLLANFNITNPYTWNTSLKIFASFVGFVGLILIIATILWFVIWIKYSWFYKTNSINVTGGQLSKLYLKKYGINANRIKFSGSNSIDHINVVSKFWYLRPYVINKNTLTLRLVPWTYHRSSIYTLAMALESSWAISSSKSSRFSSFWWEFTRRITLIFIFLPFLFALFFALGWAGFVQSDLAVIILSFIFIFFFIFYSLSQIFFYYHVQKELAENLRGILLPKEIKAISLIFFIKFVYYLIRLIYEILRFILEIIINIKN